MNNIYVYEDSFINLLNLIDQLFINNVKPYNIKTTNYNPDLFDNLVYLKIENKDILTKYKKIVDKENFKIIYYVYLSNDINKELIIYYYLLNYFKYKAKVMYMRNLNCVNKALTISNYVSRENHKFKGFTRFRELKNNVLYAEIEPENNILEILSMHFKNRLKNEFWIIKDKKREIISIYNKKKIFIYKCSQFDILDVNDSDNEEQIEKLWKLFYKTIGIEARRNDQCRRNFMPKKYWKNILEVSDEI